MVNNQSWENKQSGNMKRIDILRFSILSLLPILFTAIIASCSKKEAAEQPVVTVSIPPLAFFVEEIGGDKVRVETLAPASADPETFEPSMAMMRNLADSRVLLTTGLLPFEERLADTAPDATTIVNLSDSIEVITGTHGDAEADPHIWASLRNAQIMARHTAQVLSETYPEYADYFTSNLAELERKLEADHKEIATMLLPYRGRSFLVWHPSLSYFARDYGLRQIVLGEEHKETSINQLRNKIDRIKADSALVFFYQKELDSRQSRIVTDATGLQPVEIAPLSSDIFATIRGAAEAIAR